MKSDGTRKFADGEILLRAIEVCTLYNLFSVGMAGGLLIFTLASALTDWQVPALMVMALCVLSYFCFGFVSLSRVGQDFPGFRYKFVSKLDALMIAVFLQLWYVPYFRVAIVQVTFASLRMTEAELQAMAKAFRRSLKDAERAP